MINVLVTGALGQLARCLKDIERNYPNLNMVYTDILELDIADSKNVKEFFNKNGPFQYCINCAAYTAVDKAESDKEKSFLINAVGAKVLAEACFVENTILIHISTDFVFDGISSGDYDEQDLPNPINVYGASKLEGEKEIINKLKSYFIIRTSWLYSEHGHNFMKTMLRLSGESDSLNVINDQFGTPTYGRDLAKVIFHIIESNSSKYGIYHYSNMGKASWYDFAKAIFELSKIDTKVCPVGAKIFHTPAKRPTNSVLNKTKIINNFNIEIPLWRDSLKRAISRIHE
jgi:dTDP-4-dehydrorhamnose reductase